MAYGRRGRLRRSGPWIAVGGMAVLLWLFVASLLFAPWGAVVGFVVLWLVLALVTSRTIRVRPASSPWVPAAGFVLWVALSLAGGAWLGWGP